MIYNLLELSDNYSITSGSLWNYYRDEGNGDANENGDANYRLNISKKKKININGKTKIIVILDN